MWLIPTKKEVRKEFDKIALAFKERDDKIKELEKKIDSISRTELELMIKEIILSINSGPKSGLESGPDQIELKTEPNRTRPNQTNYTREMVRNAIKTRPEALKQAIRELLDRDMRTTDIFNLIVKEKQLISKTQFYYYLSLVRAELKTELRTLVRTNVRTEPNRTKKNKDLNETQKEN